MYVCITKIAAFTEDTSTSNPTKFHIYKIPKCNSLTFLGSHCSQHLGSPHWSLAPWDPQGPWNSWDKLRRTTGLALHCSKPQLLWWWEKDLRWIVVGKAHVSDISSKLWLIFRLSKPIIPNKFQPSSRNHPIKKMAGYTHQPPRRLAEIFIQLFHFQQLQRISNGFPQERRS